MSEKEIIIRARADTSDAEAGLERLGAKSEETANRIKASDLKIQASTRTVMMSIAHLGTSFIALGNVVDRVKEGKIGLAEAMLYMIPVVTSLVSAIYTLVKAYQSGAIAAAIMRVAESGILAPVTAAAIGVGLGIVLGSILAAQAKGSREAGGPIPFTGSYMLHAGETVNRGSSPITINVYSSDPKTSGDSVLNALRRARMVA